MLASPHSLRQGAADYVCARTGTRNERTRTLDDVMNNHAAIKLQLSVIALCLAGCRPGSAQVKQDTVVPGPTATGTLVRGPLPTGYEQVGAADPDAKEAVEAGGVFLRQAGNKAGSVIGASPMPGLPIDPADSKICSAASAQTAASSNTTLASAKVITLGNRTVCRAELTKPGTKLVTRSYTWLLDTSAKLGVMVNCSASASDGASEEACLSFVRDVAPAK